MCNSLPLNSFQQMMVQWTEFTPYNAGHVLTLRGKPDVSRWEMAILKTIQEMKLGIPEIDHQAKFVKFQPIDSITIELVTGDLDSHINTELNRPFLKNEFPIRFFILCDINNYFLGAIYNHWISDSVAMRALFQRVCERYQKGNSDLSALTLEAPKLRQAFPKHFGRFPLWDGLKEFFRCLLHFQSVYRTKMQDVMNFQTGFYRYELPENLISHLLIYAKKQNVSINDVFLSALAKVMGESTQQDRNQIKRKKLRFFPRNRLALGTIVDIRHAASQNRLDNVFGQFLSNFTVVLKNPESKSFHDLLKNISLQTDKIKKGFLTIKNFASWDISLFIWKFLSSRKSQARFFTKHAPIAAGISNVNLTPSWIGENSEILNYLRISPTGLLLPLVFTLTTLHERLSLCVSYRMTAFKPEEVKRISQEFMKILSDSIH